MLLENKQETFNLTGNIDERYFEKQEDGTYKATPTFTYNAARDALKFYHDMVVKLDKNNEYCKESVNDHKKDDWSYKIENEELWKKYPKEMEQVEEKAREWREANPDKCDVISGGPDLGDIDEMKYFAGYKSEVKPTLAQAMAAYKWLKLNYDKKTQNIQDLKAQIPSRKDKVVVKFNYRDELKQLRQKWMRDLGVEPIEEKFIKVKTKTVCKTNTKLFKGVTESTDTIDEFIQGLAQFLTSTDKATYLKQRDERMHRAWEELNEAVTEDFIMAINDSAKNLEARLVVDDVKVTDEEDYIENVVEVWTVATENTNAVRIFSLDKVMDDGEKGYKFNVDITAPSGDSLKTSFAIKVKSDIVKALKAVEALIEATPESDLKTYLDDIDRTLDNLDK